MKKKICFFLVLLMLVFSAAANNISVKINDNLFYDTVNLEGHTVIPLRTLLGALNVTDIYFHEASKTIKVSAHGKNLFIQTGSDYIIVNDELKSIGKPSYIENGITYVPLRPVAEALDAYVSYDPIKKLVTIQK